jgi:hypothetical protein
MVYSPKIRQVYAMPRFKPEGGTFFGPTGELSGGRPLQQISNIISLELPGESKP